LTIAISIKINDGLVLASDSASTFLGQGPNGELGVLNVYNNANKVFNLRKGFPIGAITWGAGSIGQASISTIIKDLRLIFTEGKGRPDWKLSKSKYTVQEVALRLKQFVFDELYVQAFKEVAFQKPDLGFIVAGYSAPDAPMAEEFQIDIKNGECSEPKLLRGQEDIGLTWGGDPEALNRVVAGMGGGLPHILQSIFKIDPSQLPQVIQLIQQQLQMPLVLPAMPLQDAIDLADFLVDLTIKFSRFSPGPPTVGGPIEIAAISKHEGFRWIKRKYYFDRRYNPEVEFSRFHESRKNEPQPNDEGEDNVSDEDEIADPHE
jgi:hypothetical protein